MPDSHILSLSETLNMALDLQNSLNTYWNLYITVSFGLLGLMASGKEYTKSRLTLILFLIAFSVFAYSNWLAIKNVVTERIVLLDSYLPLKDFPEIRPAFNQSSLEKIGMYHFFLDVCVSVGFFFIWLFKRKKIKKLKR